MRKFFVATVAGLTLAMASAPSIAQELERNNVTLAVGGRVALYYLPLNIAEINGYFAEEGINVDIVDFQGGSRSVQAVVGGSADILAAAFEHSVTMQAQGQPLTSFALMGRYPGFVLSVTPEIAQNWDGMASLKGKNVGVTAPGSSTNKMVDLLLIGENLAPSDVSIVGIGAGPSVLAAFQNGSVAATVQADPATTLLEQAGLSVPVVDTRNLEGTEQVYGGPMPAAAMMATTRFVDANPKTVQALTNAVVKALEFIDNSSPEEIVAVLPQEYLIGGDEAAYAKMLELVKPAFSPDGLLSEEAVETTYNALKIYNETVRAAGEINLEATYTNSFVEAAHGAE
ncbi:ABC transporter substrate-binding protein [Aureimonas fodinaquatilis]|uniref:ABC transporter substrate-binding protein n=1 Tax=Aureimonas fodinaquatilis TaxID=2565783 RepID=A0A5B0DR34_9HYPH|nr:ABC transporter substrate-binding protein [Aureimonas fodinaquatilis]KAA0968211.1 ABC transporter substrate-binding protein [Aureimonas fodinaquatilis]